MREILFRGKRADNGNWIEGSYVKHDTVKVCLTTDDPKTEHLIVCDGFCDWGFEPPLQGVVVIPETVGQYTGLTDKNGKRIFEGDILKMQSGNVGVVVYDDDLYASYRLKNIYDGYCHDGCCLCQAEREERLVIGNIHDDPELIEEGEADGD